MDDHAAAALCEGSIDQWARETKCIACPSKLQPLRPHHHCPRCHYTWRHATLGYQAKCPKCSAGLTRTLLALYEQFMHEATWIVNARVGTYVEPEHKEAEERSIARQASTRALIEVVQREAYLRGQRDGQRSAYLDVQQRAAKERTHTWQQRGRQRKSSIRSLQRERDGKTSSKG
jgi:hypothetical protein